MNYKVYAFIILALVLEYVSMSYIYLDWNWLYNNTFFQWTNEGRALFIALNAGYITYMTIIGVHLTRKKS